jgi:predicted secreted acid phosphatase
MVFVDFSNPYLRGLLGTYAAEHREQLDWIRAALPEWIDESSRHESARPPADRRPLAIVLDIDEVVLCNISEHTYDVGDIHFRARDYFDELGEGLCPALPGAWELIADVRSLGLTLFFVTGRREAIRAETVANFAAAKFGEATIIMRPDDDMAGANMAGADMAGAGTAGASVRPWKEARRAEIDREYRIVANVGDQASDLGDYGDRQIAVANPFYWTP